MAAESRNEVLTTYTSDVHSLVSHGAQALHRQVEQLKDVSHRDAARAVILFEQTLKRQQCALEERINALGGSATAPVKDAVAAVAGLAAGLIDAMRPAETAKAIRDDHTYFNHLGISWLMLYATATALADPETAALAKRGYEDTTKMIMHVDRIMPKIIVEELRENEALALVDVQEQTRVMVKNAWNRESETGG